MVGEPEPILSTFCKTANILLIRTANTISSVMEHGALEEIEVQNHWFIGAGEATRIM